MSGRYRWVCLICGYTDYLPQGDSFTCCGHVHMNGGVYVDPTDDERLSIVVGRLVALFPQHTDEPNWSLLDRLEEITDFISKELDKNTK